MNEEDRRANQERYYARLDAERQSDRIRRSGLPLHTREKKRFATFQVTDGNSAALDVVKALVAGELDLPFVLLIGIPGLGKTHLSTAAAWEFLERKEDVAFFQAEELLNELQSRLENGRAYGELLDDLKEARLVVLDDLGAHNPTTWRTSQLDAIIDARYRAAAPLIITSNKVATLEDRILDRAREGYTVVLTGKSWRGKGKL